MSPSSRSDYYKYLARLNFEAALAADNVIGLLPGYEIAAPPPVMTLCAHCIELSLKAYLLDRGLPEEDVRRFSHGLSNCWGKCVDLGAPPPPNSDVLEIISDLLASGRLRYGEQSTLGKVPVFGTLSELFEAALKLSGAPPLSALRVG